MLRSRVDVRSLQDPDVLEPGPPHEVARNGVVEALVVGDVPVARDWKASVVSETAHNVSEPDAVPLQRLEGRALGRPVHFRDVVSAQFPMNTYLAISMLSDVDDEVSRMTQVPSGSARIA